MHWNQADVSSSIIINICILCVKLQLKELIIFQTPDVINDHALKSQKEKVTEKSGKDNPIQEKKNSFPIIDYFHIDAPKS